MRLLALASLLGAASAQSHKAAGSTIDPDAASVEVEVCVTPPPSCANRKSRAVGIPEKCDPNLHGARARVFALQEVASNRLDGYTTYKVYLALDDGRHVKNCYAIFGETSTKGPAPRDAVMHIPPARQVPAPFGSNVGGTSPAFWGIPGHEDSQYDSWLTVSIDDGNNQNLISSIGIDFTDWSEKNALEADNGSVFWMDPDKAPDGRALVAQLTLSDSAEASQRKIIFSAQGRYKAQNGNLHGGNWQTFNLQAQLGGGKNGPPVDCSGDFGPYGGCNVCGSHGRKTRTYHILQPAINGGHPCLILNNSKQTTACKPGERPCPLLSHDLHCSSTSDEVMTELTGPRIARALYTLVLDSAQSVTIRNQLPKDKPSLQLFDGDNTSAAPLITGNRQGAGITGALAAGNYTIVADTALSRESPVSLTTFCREPTGPVLNPRQQGRDHPPGTHSTTAGGDTHSDVDGAGGDDAPIEWIGGLVVLGGIVGGCCVLCVMKQANGTLAVSKRRQDLDAQLDRGLDSDFGSEARFSTQSVQSIGSGGHSYAE